YDETYTGEGLRVSEVIAGGPFDRSGARLDAGSVILAIDGEKIDDHTDWARLLNRKAGKFTLVTGRNSAGAAFSETVKPITLSQEIPLMYKRWVKSRRELVEKLSNG